MKDEHGCVPSRHDVFFQVQMLLPTHSASTETSLVTCPASTTEKKTLTFAWLETFTRTHTHTHTYALSLSHTHTHPHTHTSTLSLSYTLTFKVSLPPSSFLFLQRRNQKKEKNEITRTMMAHNFQGCRCFFQARPRVSPPTPPTSHLHGGSKACTNLQPMMQWSQFVRGRGVGRTESEAVSTYFAYKPDPEKDKFLTMGFVGAVIWVESRNGFSCSSILPSLKSHRLLHFHTIVRFGTLWWAINLLTKT